ncbi:hypothetical protein FOPE_12654 [Fonsecaea pedrosoi]|nr:hypothetical protein FOPE_12654 [Fonsecaea pedrosoi]
MSIGDLEEFGHLRELDQMRGFLRGDEVLEKVPIRVQVPDADNRRQHGYQYERQCPNWRHIGIGYAYRGAFTQASGEIWATSKNEENWLIWMW